MCLVLAEEDLISMKEIVRILSHSSVLDSCPTNPIDPGPFTNEDLLPERIKSAIVGNSGGQDSGGRLGAKLMRLAVACFGHSKGTLQHGVCVLGVLLQNGEIAYVDEGLGNFVSMCIIAVKNSNICNLQRFDSTSVDKTYKASMIDATRASGSCGKFKDLWSGGEGPAWCL